MTNKYKILTTLLLASCSLSLYGGTIVGSKHDLANNGWGTTETCKFCHTPHFAVGIVDAPLWNRQVSVATYTLYASPSFKGARTQTQPSTSSKLCLGCHDGTIAVDSYAGAQGSHFITATNTIGGESRLSSDHPISFEYNAALVRDNRTLASPVSAKFVDADHTLPLYDGKLECASCHEPHDPEQSKFLRMNNGTSALCLKCHLK